MIDKVELNSDCLCAQLADYKAARLEACVVGDTSVATMEDNTFVEEDTTASEQGGTSPRENDIVVEEATTTEQEDTSPKECDENEFIDMLMKRGLQDEPVLNNYVQSFDGPPHIRNSSGRLISPARTGSRKASTRQEPDFSQFEKGLRLQILKPDMKYYKAEVVAGSRRRGAYKDPLAWPLHACR